jgi:hypothetical protein
MPHEYSIDAARRLVRVRMWGELTRAEIMATGAELSNDPLLRPEFSELIDLRGVTSAIAISAEDVRAIASAALSPVARRAFAASDLAMFGLARMFATLRDLTETREQVGVFRTLEEAEAWLGLEPPT